MQYSQEALLQMALEIDLLEYMGRTVDFVRHSNDTHFCVCPFHDEDTASLAVKESGQYFHCFGCGKSGNIYTWIMLTEGLSFDQAVQKVAKLTNSSLHDYVISESMAVYKELDKLNNKNEEEVQREYLNIDDYDNKYLDEPPQEWLDEGIQREELKKYDIRLDPFSNRIVYPVLDADFRMIGIKGRTRFQNYKQLRVPKYMNYNKIGILDYFTGMKQAESYIKDRNSVIIVEGIKSVMKLDQWGFHNVVSAETSALSDKQVELLIRMGIKDVIIAFDQDVKASKIKECTKMLSRFTNTYAVLDRWKLLKPKDSPCDQGLSTFKKLYDGRCRI